MVIIIPFLLVTRNNDLKWSTFVNRLVPLDRFCVANPDAVVATAKDFIDAHPQFSGNEPVKVTALLLSVSFYANPFVVSLVRYRLCIAEQRQGNEEGMHWCRRTAGSTAPQSGPFSTWFGYHRRGVQGKSFVLIVFGGKQCSISFFFPPLSLFAAWG